MSIFSLLFNTGRLESPIAPAGYGTKLLTAVKLRELAMQLESGMQDPITLSAKVTPLQASQTIILDGAAGTVGVTVNGVTNNVTAAGGDVATAALIAAAINASANALVSGIVTASSAAGAGSTGVLTITSVDRSKTANAITVAAVGTGLTATGARLVNGSNGTETSYSY